MDVVDRLVLIGTYKAANISKTSITSQRGDTNLEFIEPKNNISSGSFQRSMVNSLMEIMYLLQAK